MKERIEKISLLQRNNKNINNERFWYSKNAIDIFNYLKETFPSIREGIYRILNDDFDDHICLNERCNNATEFRTKNFLKFCCTKCSATSSYRKDKIKATNLMRYGVENAFNTEQTKKTLKERYGVENISQLEETQDKIRKTCNEKYGSNSIFGANEVQTKIKNTLMKNFGVDHNFKIQGSFDNRKKLWEEKYGVDNPSKSEIVKQKISNKISIQKTNFYLKCRTSVGFKGLVYILYFNNIDKVKIGSAFTLENRKGLLIEDFGEFEILAIFETNDRYGLEFQMHQLFEEFRSPECNGCGRTEFFSNEIMQSSEFKNLVSTHPLLVKTL